MKKLNCKYCGKDFLSKNYLDRKYCSPECGAKGRTFLKDLECLNCGKVFHQYDKNGKFCSNKCVGEYQRGKAINLLERTRNCEYCNKEFEVRYKNSSQKYCGRECLFKSQSGENHWMWRGGESFTKYPQEFNEELKENIRDRDGRICQMCLIAESETETKNRLDVHHIDWDKQNLDPTNLISLCAVCHTKLHVKENIERNYFKKLAITNNNTNL